MPTRCTNSSRTPIFCGAAKETLLNWTLGLFLLTFSACAAMCGRSRISTTSYDPRSLNGERPNTRCIRSALVQNGGHLRAACAFVLRQQRRWSRGFPRFDRKARLSARLGRKCHLAFALLPVALEGRWL